MKQRNWVIVSSTYTYRNSKTYQSPTGSSGLLSVRRFT